MSSKENKKRNLSQSESKKTKISCFQETCKKENYLQM